MTESIGWIMVAAQAALASRKQINFSHFEEISRNSFKMRITIDDIKSLGHNDYGQLAHSARLHMAITSHN